MTHDATTTLLLVLTATAPVAAAAIAGNLATVPNIPTWYVHLAKPSFNPPNWVFAPVWTTLYLMMAYAFYRVLSSGSDWMSFAVAIFLIQIALNAAWSWVFFSFHSPRGGAGRYCSSLAGNFSYDRCFLADRPHGVRVARSLPGVGQLRGRSELGDRPAKLTGRDQKSRGRHEKDCISAMRRIEVNGKMQRGYHYALSAPTGGRFRSCVQAGPDTRPNASSGRV